MQNNHTAMCQFGRVGRAHKSPRRCLLPLCRADEATPTHMIQAKWTGRRERYRPKAVPHVSAIAILAYRVFTLIRRGPSGLWCCHSFFGKVNKSLTASVPRTTSSLISALRQLVFTDHGTEDRLGKDNSAIVNHNHGLPPERDFSFAVTMVTATPRAGISVAVRAF